MLYEKKLLLFDCQDLLFRQVLFHGMREISYLILVKNNRSESLSKEQMAEILHSRIGERCIYFENVTILHGLVKDYWEDNQGIVLALEVLPAVGLQHPPQRLTLSSGWDDFSVTASHLHAYQPGWHLFFHPELIDKVLGTAADNATNPNPNERFVNVMDAILVSLEKLGDE